MGIARVRLCNRSEYKGQLRFYVLIATGSHREAVPAPYQPRIAVNLSRAGELCSFADRLLEQFGDSTKVTDPWRASAALIDCCTELERVDAHAHAELESRRRIMRYRRVRWQRDCLIATALVVGISCVWMVTAVVRANTASDDAQSALSRMDANVRANYSRIRGVVIDQTDTAIKVDGANISAHAGDRDGTVSAESAEGGKFDLDIGGMSLRDNTLIRLDVGKAGFAKAQRSFLYRDNLVEHTIPLTKVEATRNER